jgi:protein-disulfide isomerase
MHRPTPVAALALVLALAAAQQAMASRPQAAAGVNPSAAEPPLTPEQEAAVETIVARWMARHPDSRAMDRDPAGAPWLSDDGDGSLGRADARTTLVAFLDRGSAASSGELPVLAALAARDPDLRVVIKEMPLADGASVDAARAAFAARAQGASAYGRFEAASIDAGGARDGRAARAAAVAAGLDMARFDADAASSAALDYLRRTRAEAMALGVRATPTFLVGDRALVGARGMDGLRAAIARAREAGR